MLGGVTTNDFSGLFADEKTEKIDSVGIRTFKQTLYRAHADAFIQRGATTGLACMGLAEDAVLRADGYSAEAYAFGEACLLSVFE